MVQNRVGTTSHTYQIDVSSIRVEGEVRLAWVKDTPARHTMKGYGGNAKKFVSCAMMRFAFNCPDGSKKVDALSSYFEDGSFDTVNVAYVPQLATWDPVPPDTALSAVMQSVCSWKPK